MSEFNQLDYISVGYASENQACEKECNDKLDELNIKIDQLNQRIKVLETEKQATDESNQKKLRFMQEDMKELSNILEHVEKRTIMDSISLGGELRTRFDWYEFTGHDINLLSGEVESSDIRERVRCLPSNRFRIHLKTHITKDLQFHGRLVMHRNWADDDIPQYPDANFLNTARIPTSIDLKVERAYVDYFFNMTKRLPMAFTFGRIPNIDGLPTDLRENTPRKSTYPGLAYDVETDGIGISIFLKHFIKFPNPALRMIFVRKFDDNEKYFLSQKLSNKAGDYRNDPDAMLPLDIYAAQFETEFPKPLDDSIFIINVIYIPKAPSSDLRYRSELYPFYEDNSPLSLEIPDSEGQFFKLTLFFESKDFLNSKIDWFFGLGFIKTYAEGAMRFMFNPKPLNIPGEPVLARDAYKTYSYLIQEFPSIGPLLDSLKNAPTPIGLLNNDGVSDREGYGIHMGIRFNVPFLNKLNHPPKLGIEYNYGSRYWYGMNTGSEDPLHKLDCRGAVWDFYYLHSFNKFFSLRSGFTHVSYHYNDGLSFYHGEPQPIDHDVYQSYILVDAKF